METVLMVIAGFGASGLLVMGYAGWWVVSAIERSTGALEKRVERLEAQGGELAGKVAEMRGELHFARIKLGSVGEEVVAVRAELAAFVHGPPSLRPGSAVARTT